MINATLRCGQACVSDCLLNKRYPSAKKLEARVLSSSYRKALVKGRLLGDEEIDQTIRTCDSCILNNDAKQRLISALYDQYDTRSRPNSDLL
jgi:hypothetical protein